jgi:hypothetical protein
MARRRSASIQARHVPGCAVGRPWTPLDGLKNCTCKKINGHGPLFHIVSRPNDKQIRTAVGYDKQEAERRRGEVLGNIADGTHEAPKNMTYTIWADQWFAGSKRPNENMKRSYKTMIGYSKSAFGDKIVRQLTGQDVVRMLELVKHTSPTAAERSEHLRRYELAARQYWKPLRSVRLAVRLLHSGLLVARSAPRLMQHRTTAAAVALQSPQPGTPQPAPTGT